MAFAFFTESISFPCHVKLRLCMASSLALCRASKFFNKKSQLSSG